MDGEERRRVLELWEGDEKLHFEDSPLVTFGAAVGGVYPSTPSTKIPVKGEDDGFEAMEGHSGLLDGVDGGVRAALDESRVFFGSEQEDKSSGRGGRGEGMGEKADKLAQFGSKLLEASLGLCGVDIVLEEAYMRYSVVYRELQRQLRHGTAAKTALRLLRAGSTRFGLHWGKHLMSCHETDGVGARATAFVALGCVGAFQRGQEGLLDEIALFRPCALAGWTLRLSMREIEGCEEEIHVPTSLEELISTTTSSCKSATPSQLSAVTTAAGVPSFPASSSAVSSSVDVVDRMLGKKACIDRVWGFEIAALTTLCEARNQPPTLALSFSSQLLDGATVAALLNLPSHSHTAAPSSSSSSSSTSAVHQSYRMRGISSEARLAVLLPLFLGVGELCWLQGKNDVGVGLLNRFECLLGSASDLEALSALQLPTLVAPEVTTPLPPPHSSIMEEQLVSQRIRAVHSSRASLDEPIGPLPFMSAAIRDFTIRFTSHPVLLPTTLPPLPPLPAPRPLPLSEMPLDPLSVLASECLSIVEDEASADVEEEADVGWDEGDDVESDGTVLFGDGYAPQLPSATICRAASLEEKSEHADEGKGEGGGRGGGRGRVVLASTEAIPVVGVVIGETVACALVEQYVVGLCVDDAPTVVTPLPGVVCRCLEHLQWHLEVRSSRAWGTPSSKLTTQALACARIASRAATSWLLATIDLPSRDSLLTPFLFPHSSHRPTPSNTEGPFSWLHPTAWNADWSRDLDEFAGEFREDVAEGIVAIAAEDDTASALFRSRTAALAILLQSVALCQGCDEPRVWEEVWGSWPGLRGGMNWGIVDSARVLHDVRGSGKDGVLDALCVVIGVAFLADMKSGIVGALLKSYAHTLAWLSSEDATSQPPNPISSHLSELRGSSASDASSNDDKASNGTTGMREPGKKGLASLFSSATRKPSTKLGEAEERDEGGGEESVGERDACDGGEGEGGGVGLTAAGKSSCPSSMTFHRSTFVAAASNWLLARYDLTKVGILRALGRMMVTGSGELADARRGALVRRLCFASDGKEEDVIGRIGEEVVVDVMQGEFRFFGKMLEPKSDDSLDVSAVFQFRSNSKAAGLIPVVLQGVLEEWSERRDVTALPLAFLFQCDVSMMKRGLRASPSKKRKTGAKRRSKRSATYFEDTDEDEEENGAGEYDPEEDGDDDEEKGDGRVSFSPFPVVNAVIHHTSSASLLTSICISFASSCIEKHLNPPSPSLPSTSSSSSSASAPFSCPNHVALTLRRIARWLAKDLRSADGVHGGKRRALALDAVAAAAVLLFPRASSIGQRRLLAAFECARRAMRGAVLTQLRSLTVPPKAALFFPLPRAPLPIALNCALSSISPDALTALGNPKPILPRQSSTTTAAQLPPASSIGVTRGGGGAGLRRHAAVGVEGKGKKKPRKKKATSSNPVIAAWMEEDGGMDSDTYADLEDFIV